jgi:hypothetical protein
MTVLYCGFLPLAADKEIQGGTRSSSFQRIEKSTLRSEVEAYRAKEAPPVHIGLKEISRLEPCSLFESPTGFLLAKVHHFGPLARTPKAGPGGNHD